MIIIIGSMHIRHFLLLPGPLLPSFTGVTDDTNEGSVPFWSNSQGAAIVHVGSLETLCYTSLKVSLSGFQMSPYGCVTLRVYTQSYGVLEIKTFENHCTLNGTEP